MNQEVQYRRVPVSTFLSFIELVSFYKRISVQLASGLSAWVYMDAQLVLDECENDCVIKMV